MHHSKSRSHRTHHLWLIQKDLDLEIFAQFHLCERFLGSIGTLFGLFALLAREQCECPNEQKEWNSLETAISTSEPCTNEGDGSELSANL
jgi:hypothetical protein